MDLGLEGLHAGGKVIRHARQNRRVDRDPGILHIRQNRNQRAFQPLIDRCHSFGGEPWTQHLPEAKRDVGILCRIIERGFRRQRAERHLLGAFATDILVFDCAVIQPVTGQIIHRMARHPPGIQHIGKAHRVIDRGQPDAAIHRPQKHMAVIFQIVADLQDRRVLEQGLQHRDGIIEPDLVIDCRWRIKRETTLPVRLDNGPAMAKWHIAGAPRGQRHRHAHHFGRRRVQRTGFGIHRQIALLARRRSPFFKLGERCDQLIADLAFGKRY